MSSVHDLVMCGERRTTDMLNSVGATAERWDARKNECHIIAQPDPNVKWHIPPPRVKINAKK